MGDQHFKDTAPARPGPPGLLDGDWGPYNGGYAIRVGQIFFGFIRQRGGDSIYSKLWQVSLNKVYVGETNDQDHAQGWVERLICEELEFLRPTLDRLSFRAPPTKCFDGPDSLVQWRIWKEDRAIAGWTFTEPTPRQRYAAMKKNSP
jgi:hypothetical protein